MNLIFEEFRRIFQVHFFFLHRLVNGSKSETAKSITTCHHTTILTIQCLFYDRSDRLQIILKVSRCKLTVYQRSKRIVSQITKDENDLDNNQRIIMYDLRDITETLSLGRPTRDLMKYTAKGINAFNMLVQLKDENITLICLHLMVMPVSVQFCSVASMI